MNVPEYWKQGILGSSLTSIKIGGKLTFYAKTTTIEQLAETFALIKGEGLSSMIIGGGSNLILADGGFEGVCVQPAFGGIKPIEDLVSEGWSVDGKELSPQVVAPRYDPQKGEGLLNLTEAKKERVGTYRYIEMGAGVPWGQAVTASLKLNLSGLQWFARIPCQVGGAVYNNIHGATHLLSESVAGVKAFDPTTGEEVIFSGTEVGFGYDMSVFHTNGMVITGVLFRLIEVSPEEAKADLGHYLEWTKEKAAVQPSGANCGSVFQNLQGKLVREKGLTSGSAAWYIDRCGWKGKERGGLQVYPGHANFIVNSGAGTQEDFIGLVEDIRASVYKEFGVYLYPEAECLDISGNTIQWQSLSAPNS